MNKTDIWNRALIELGERTVTNIETDTTKEAKTGNTLYQPALDELLRDHLWGFARKEVALAVVSGATSCEWDYVYALPADCIKVRDVFRALSKSDPVPYEKRAGANKDSTEILTDQEGAVLVYTATITNANIMDKGFVNALVYYLASKSAKTLTGDTQLKKDMMEEFDRAWLKATRGDSDELIDKSNPVSPAEAARNA